MIIKDESLKKEGCLGLFAVHNLWLRSAFPSRKAYSTRLLTWTSFAVAHSCKNPQTKSLGSCPKLINIHLPHTFYNMNNFRCQ